MRACLSVVASIALALIAQPASSQDARLLERGTYLMNSIVACGNCHAQRDKQGRVMPELGLSGGLVFDEKPFKAYASNITPDPIVEAVTVRRPTGGKAVTACAAAGVRSDR